MYILSLLGVAARVFTLEPRLALAGIVDSAHRLAAVSSRPQAVRRRRIIAAAADWPGRRRRYNGGEKCRCFSRTAGTSRRSDHELIDGKLLSRTLLGEHVLLYRGESGNVVALNDRCPHRGALLSQGRLEGDGVRCMYHGIKYDGSGKCVQIPGQDMIPPKLKVRSYPVVERSHFIWIWMGDAAKADPALIIDLPYLSDPKWKGIPAYLHYDANYLLIVDNLSDFSHLAFVHTKTLGGSEEYAFVTQTDRRRATGARLSRRALAPRQRSAAVPQEGDSRQDRQGGPPQYRHHDRTRHLHTWKRCSRRPARAPRRAMSPAPRSTGIVSS